MDADTGGRRLDKKLNSGLNIPQETIPKMMTAINGAIRLPTRTMAMQKTAMKKRKTAFWERFCSKLHHIRMLGGRRCFVNG